MNKGPFRISACAVVAGYVFGFKKTSSLTTDSRKFDSVLKSVKLGSYQQHLAIKGVMGRVVHSQQIGMQLMRFQQRRARLIP